MIMSTSPFLESIRQVLRTKHYQSASQPLIEVNNINMLIKTDYQCGYDNPHR